MKTVCNLNMCTGCKACVQVCQESAISLIDSIKNLNAVIDEDKCIRCNACERVCQQVRLLDVRPPIKWFQGWAKNECSRSRSSSGGFAYQIMKKFLEEDGFVCSCTFKNGCFSYSVAGSVSEINQFRGSKYVKSDPKGIYSTIKELIKSGNKILFLGLPCHVAALKRYVGGINSENLFTVDLICHGSPSEKILSEFLAEKGIDIKEINNISFREKNKFRISCEGEKAVQITPFGVRDRYTIGFLNGLFYTENCYSCRYAGLDRVSDITIGDSWGSDLEDTDEGRKGISLALCQTQRGVDLLKKCDIKIMDVDLDKAVTANHQLQKPSRVPDERTMFFDLIASGESVNKAIAKCYPETCRRQDIKSILTKLHVLNGR